MKAIIYKDDLGKEQEVVDIPAEHADEADAAREHLLNERRRARRRAGRARARGAGGGDTVPVERLKAAIRRATLAHPDHPGLLRLGVQEQGRAAAARRGPRLPAQPAGRPAGRGRTRRSQGRRRAREAAVREPTTPRRSRRSPSRSWPTRSSASSPTSASTPASSRPARRVLNVSTGRTERVGRILMMHANDREEVEEVYAGDIAAGVGIKQVVTGDTLAAPGPADPAGDHRLPRAGHQGRRRAEDEGRPGEDVGRARPPRRGGPDVPGRRPTRRPARPRSPGMGELHLEMLVDRMKREFNVEANVGRPQVSYRETIRGTATKVEGRHVKQTGGSGQYGIVYIDIEPAPGEGFDFSEQDQGRLRADRVHPRRREGRARRRCRPACKAGYPMVDVRVTLTDGKYHDTDSSEIAFKIAGSLALPGGGPAGQARAARAGVRRRGRDARGVPRRRHRRPQPAPRPRRGPGAARQRARGHRARAAVGDVRLRDRRAVHTQGRATYTMQFDGYEEVPPNIAEKIVGERTGERRTAPDPHLSFAIFEFPTARVLEERIPQWRRRSSSATSRTSTSAPSVTSTMARRP